MHIEMRRLIDETNREYNLVINRFRFPRGSIMCTHEFEEGIPRGKSVSP